MDEMIAALSGSTALPAIEVFHALLAGNGRLIGPRTSAFVTATAVDAAFVAVAVEDDGAPLGLPLGVGLAENDEGVDGDSTTRLACASAACDAPCVQPPPSRASATRAVAGTYWWGRRTVAG